jgi:hypothetical protein
MTKVWVVETGEYSAYQVRAIFAEENEEMAREYAKGVGSEPREWVLDTWTPDQGRWEFDLNLEGDVVREKFEALIEGKEDPEGESRREYSTRFRKDVITIAVRHGERARALKVASERFTKIRSFLDEADERVARANYLKIDGYHFNDAWQAAEILAGLEPVPNPPECGADRNMLLILGIEPIKEKP